MTDLTQPHGILSPAEAVLFASVAARLTKPWTLDGTLKATDNASVDRLFNDPDKAHIRRQHLRPMLQNDVVGGAVRKRRGAVLALPLRLVGEDDEEADGREATFILREINKVRRRFVNAVYGGILYGYGVADVIFKNYAAEGDTNVTDENTLSGDRVGVSSVLAMKFEDFRLSIDGTLRLSTSVTIKTDGTPDEKQARLNMDIDSGKIIYFVNAPSHDNPYGEALLADIYVAWSILCHTREQWAKATSRFGSAFLKGKVSNPNQTMTVGGETITALQAMVAALDAAERGASIVHGPDDDVAALDVPDGAASFEKLYDRCEASIQRVILGQNVTSGQRAGGSMALGVVTDGLRIEERDADIDFITPEIQKLVNSLWARNEFAGRAPRVEFATPRNLNPEQAARDAALAPVMTAAAVKFTAQYFREQYGFDEAYLTDAAAEPAPPDEEPAPPGAKRAVKVKQSAGGRVGATEAADEISAAALRLAAAQPIEPDTLLAAVRGATSEEDLDNRLKRLLADPTNYVAFARLQRDARVTAQVLGLLTAANRTN